MWFGRRPWWRRLLGAAWTVLRWALTIGASLLPVLALDLITDKVRARTLWRRLKWKLDDLRVWARGVPDRLYTLFVYGLGISEYRWRQLRHRYQTGAYGEKGT